MTKISHPLANLSFFLLLMAALVFIIFNPLFVKKAESNVDISAQVGANQINQLTDQLKNKETALTQKEVELNKKTQSFSLGQRLLTAGLILLFWLVILNFYFDYKRSLQIFRNVSRGK